MNEANRGFDEAVRRGLARIKIFKTCTAYDTTKATCELLSNVLESMLEPCDAKLSPQEPRECKVCKGTQYKNGNKWTCEYCCEPEEKRLSTSGMISDEVGSGSPENSSKEEHTEPIDVGVKCVLCMDSGCNKCEPEEKKTQHEEAVEGIKKAIDFAYTEVSCYHCVKDGKGIRDVYEEYKKKMTKVEDIEYLGFGVVEDMWNAIKLYCEGGQDE